MTNHSETRDAIAHRPFWTTRDGTSIDTRKRRKRNDWALTIVLMVPAAGGGVVESFTNGPQGVVQTMRLLGSPLCLMKILGFSKKVCNYDRTLG